MIINRRQARILPLAHQRGSITAQSLRRVFDCSRETIRRDLAVLVGLGLLERRGRGKGTRYLPVGEEVKGDAVESKGRGAGSTTGDL